MINMSTWEDLVVDVVDELHLDPQNVRLESTEGVTESDIVHDLFANEKALDLVEGIVKVGLLTHEIPIVVDRDGKIVVVEGNRRVAALKAIQNPYLAPEHQARITKLAQDLPDREALRKITVKQAPSQDEADQVIAALHTGNQRVAWTPSRQAAFFQAQIDAGKTLEELLVQYPTIDVRKFVARSRILKLFRSVDYSDPELKDFVSNRKFPVSTLARLYDYDKFLELAQIRVDESSATVTLTAPPRQFARLAEKIIRDIKNKKINTRRLNSTKSESYVSYMGELRDLLGEMSEDESDEGPVTEGGQPSAPGGRSSGTTKGNSSAQNQTHNSSTDEPSEQNPRAGTSPKRNMRKYLDTENIQVSGNFPPTIGKILKEVADLDVTRFPNATLDLLRTFLEKTIKAYADSLGEEIRNTSNDNGYVYLKHCLIWLEDHVKTSGQRKYIQVIQKIRGGRIQGYVTSMDYLNAINHNHEICATADDVRESWDTMQGLLRMMLKS